MGSTLALVLSPLGYSPADTASASCCLITIGWKGFPEKTVVADRVNLEFFWPRSWNHKYSYSKNSMESFGHHGVIMSFGWLIIHITTTLYLQWSPWLRYSKTDLGLVSHMHVRSIWAAPWLPILCVGDSTMLKSSNCELYHALAGNARGPSGVPVPSAARLV